MRYRVTGSRPVAGKTRGQTVELDPVKVNIQALLDARHVEPVPVKKVSARGELRSA